MYIYLHIHSEPILIFARSHGRREGILGIHPILHCVAYRIHISFIITISSLWACSHLYFKIYFGICVCVCMWVRPCRILLSQWWWYQRVSESMCGKKRCSRKIDEKNEVNSGMGSTLTSSSSFFRETGDGAQRSRKKIDLMKWTDEMSSLHWAIGLYLGCSQFIFLFFVDLPLFFYLWILEDT